MNEDQTPQEIAASVEDHAALAADRKAAGYEVRFNGERLNDVREIVVSPKQHAKLADRTPDIAKLKNELRLKTAARYGNRHDRRQAESLARKTATKAKHLVWKKASQKGTPVAATPLPAGAHQPGILNSAKRAVRELAEDNCASKGWFCAGPNAMCDTCHQGFVPAEATS